MGRLAPGANRKRTVIFTVCSRFAHVHSLPVVCPRFAPGANGTMPVVTRVAMLTRIWMKDLAPMSPTLPARPRDVRSQLLAKLNTLDCAATNKKKKKAVWKTTNVPQELLANSMFTNVLVPLAHQLAGTLANPWAALTVEQVQALVDAVWPDIDYEVERGDVVITLVRLL